MNIDIIILLVLIFIVWKVMKMLYDLMQRKISNTNSTPSKTNTEDIE